MVTPRLQRGLYHVLTDAAGVAVCMASHYPTSSSSTRITMLYTPQEFRGRGFGRQAGEFPSGSFRACSHWCLLSRGKAPAPRCAPLSWQSGWTCLSCVHSMRAGLAGPGARGASEITYTAHKSSCVVLHNRLRCKQVYITAGRAFTNNLDSKSNTPHQDHAVTSEMWVLTCGALLEHMCADGSTALPSCHHCSVPAVLAACCSRVCGHLPHGRPGGASSEPLVSSELVDSGAADA